MFGKDEKYADVRSGTADAVLSIVAAGTRVVGDIEGSGLIKVEGRVEGSINGARQIIVGRDGHIRGDISGTEVILAGSVEGSITATERVELQTTGEVSGDVQTRIIVVHEGARLNGTVRMGLAASGEAGDRPAVQVMR